MYELCCVGITEKISLWVSLRDLIEMMNITLQKIFLSAESKVRKIGL